MTSKNDQIELNPHGRILVVDDEPRNRKLLRDILEVNGHTFTFSLPWGDRWGTS